MSELHKRDLKVRPEISPKVFIIQIGPQAKKTSLVIAEELRKGGIPCSHSLSRASLKAQLKSADRLRVPLVLIIGQKEAIDKQAILREMKSGTQDMVPFSKIPTVIKMKLKQL